MNKKPPELAEFALAPNPDDARLTHTVDGVDQTGATIDIPVVQERALTLYLNSQEIVTMMTIGDHPDLLAVGYLRNQAMLRDDDEITGIDYDDDLEVVVVRTKRATNYEEKLKKKVRTSGCAQGTAYGDMMESFENRQLNPNARLKTSWLYELVKKINQRPSLYLKSGAIHGCVLAAEDRPLLYLEDVGRHNAADKIAGYLFLNQVPTDDKIFYTTGRLTSEMVIKCVAMEIPILVSRSGFTAFGVDLARRAGLTLIGRARGQRFVVLSGVERVDFDAALSAVAHEPGHRRKGVQ